MARSSKSIEAETRLLKLWVEYTPAKREQQLGEMRAILDNPVGFSDDQIARFASTVEMLQDWHEELA